MKRGRPRLDGLDDLLPGKNFVREAIRAAAIGNHHRGSLMAAPRTRTLVAIEGTGRDLDFIARYKQGSTLAEIGKLYGISRERVRQRLAKHGISRESGGKFAQKIFNATDRKTQQRERQEAKCLRVYGVGLTAFEQIAGHPYKPGTMRSRHPILRAYYYQKKAAAHRGIEWKFTLTSWWAVWLESGKWADRGRGKGYCMARWADEGPYSPENVYICTVGQNFSDSWVVRKAKLAKAA